MYKSDLKSGYKRIAIYFSLVEEEVLEATRNKDLWLPFFLT